MLQYVQVKGVCNAVNCICGSMMMACNCDFPLRKRRTTVKCLYKCWKLFLALIYLIWRLRKRCIKMQSLKSQLQSVQCTCPRLLGRYALPLCKIRRYRKTLILSAVSGVADEDPVSRDSGNEYVPWRWVANVCLFQYHTTPRLTFIRPFSRIQIPIRLPQPQKHHSLMWMAPVYAPTSFSHLSCTDCLSCSSRSK